MDKDGDNMVTFRDFSSVLGSICLSDYSEKLRVLYQLHQEPCLLVTDVEDTVIENGKFIF